MSRRGSWRPVFDDKSRFVDRFGMLLLLTILTICILSLVDMTEVASKPMARFGTLVASFLVGATLLLALRSSGLAQRWRRIADVVVIVGLSGLTLLSLAATWNERLYNPLPAPVMIVVLAALAPVVIIRRLITHRVVTLGTLLGAIAGYLLISVAFFYAFLLATELQGGSFFGHPLPTTNYMYFSLVTITTVGYGDLVPTANVDRLLANAEMVIGQVYLVTFVAMIVGLYASQRRNGDDGPAL